ncbi:MAG TPA: tetratricopeptide repeat protein [Lachnospiraceae bacterium]|jgi:tetratricopeptide (TPR) repeat protein|nr:putative tetratricopeptide repeat-containing domain protein [Butyrivibrio sp. CAG:318]HJI30790.1 tetratricopeptide repeat protein [Lachnospiraceae bacterium]
MRCYKCNSVLSDEDYCLKCGADVSVYKIVVKASNSYYNQGLEKARVRDLTGAVTALKTSLSLNKKNIKARNLLGLVYYEMGELAMALSEWVISLNLKQDRNVAEVYIRKVKSNPNKLELINQAARRYNIALAKAKEGGDDVALIQLKKVAATYPKFIRANLLLALIYMKRNEDERALKVLHRVLKIDRNNTLALKYIDEINGASQTQPADGNEEYYRNSKRKPLSGNDVILPRNSYKEPSSGVFTVVYILLGVVIGAALIWFLIVPAKLQSSQHENNDTIKKYSEQLSGYSVEITTLEKQNEELTSQLDAANKELEQYKGDSGETALYAKLVEAVSEYLANDVDKAALALADIDVTQLPTQTAKDLYTTLEDKCNGGARTFYMAGLNAYNQKNYVDAAKYLEKAYELDNKSVETPYYLAMSYFELNDLENAQKYVDVVNSKFGDTTFAKQLKEYVDSRTEE